MRNKLEQKLNELERKLDDGLNELKKLKAKLEAEKLAGLKIGDTFELIGKKWKILDSNENDMLCICMEYLKWDIQILIQQKNIITKTEKIWNKKKRQ